MVDSAFELARLPYVDEHRIRVRAEPPLVWLALGHTLRQPSSRVTCLGAKLLGAQPASSTGDPLIEGSTLPGFVVVRSAPPVELALQGRHRFSQYALTFRIAVDDGDATTLRAETRAAFPGLIGRAYQALVIDSNGHRVAVRRLLRKTRKISEESGPAGGPLPCR